MSRRPLRILCSLVTAVLAIGVLAAVGTGPASAAAPPQRQALVLRVTWPGADSSASDGLDTAITGGVDTWMQTASRTLFSGWTVTDPGVITIAKPTLSPSPNQCDNTFLHSIHVPVDAAALAAGDDINNFDVVIYWFPGEPCSWSGLGDIAGLRVHLNGTIDQSVLVHELGHHLGLDHGHALDCRDGAGNQVPLSADCTSNEYGDSVNEMGTGVGTYSAGQLAQLGWIGGLIADVPPTGGAYLVSPLDSLPPGTGVHAIRIADGATTLWVEYRVPSSLDSYPGDQGVFVHLEKPDTDTPAGSFLLTMSPATPQLASGATWTDPLGHMSITVDYAGSSAAHITVTTSQRQVPNVLGETLAQAISSLSGAGLILGRKSTVNNCVDAGSVQVQDPTAGVLVDPGTPVAITTSTCTGHGGGGGIPK